ncbi:MAG: PolC-type DNA polymerase III [Oscillospiraceae bacterium]|jgi:DNA polymerase-3 subunit alpha (Gram-positive type)|nr:PolC-type DNA polymerase III [Oscillospiraceae bacterium]
MSGRAAEKRFSELFPGLAPLGGDPWVAAVKIYKESLRMEVDARDEGGFIRQDWESEAAEKLRQAYGLKETAVALAREAPPPPSLPAPRPKSKDANVLLGAPFKAKHKSPGSVPFEEGAVVVGGKVVKIECRELREDKTRVVIDIGDSTGARRLAGVFARARADRIQRGARDAQKAGDLLLCKGKMERRTYRDSDEWEITPTDIVRAPSPVREDTAEHKRVELHLHTQMSRLDAVTDAAAAVARAAYWGHSAIAVTDHGVCHAFPDACAAAEKAGIKLIYGMEGYMPHSERNYHIIILAKDRRGLKNLYKLVSVSHIEHFRSRPLIPKELLQEHREGLLIGSACEAGEVYRAVLDNKPREELEAIARFYDYLEIQPVCNNMYLVRNGKVPGEGGLREINRRIAALGEELGLPVCATCDAHFLDPEDEVGRQVLLTAQGMADGEPLPLYFRTTNEMLAEFAYLGDGLARRVVSEYPARIAALCETMRPVPEGEFTPVIEGSAEELERVVWARARELYGDDLPPLLRERLAMELRSIIAKGYDVIYILARKIVRRSVESGYYVGSRGSVGSSVAAYMAGITEVNALPPHYLCACRYREFPENPPGCGVDMPDKDCPLCGKPLKKDGYNLSFAIFQGFEMDKKPDIDLNFSDEYQERAHAHTVELFGASQVYRAGTISTLKEKTAYGYAKKYLEKNELPADNPAELNRLALGCMGVKMTTGQHPGGLVVVPRGHEITDFCPVHYPANDKTQMVTTHFDYHSIEENLLKLDLLGHKNPTMIKYLTALTGVDVMALPLDDKPTMGIFASSQALGYENDPLLGPTGAVAVPEFGTRFVRKMLQATKPSCFEDLLRISGLSHGTRVWKDNQEELVRKKIAVLGEIICSRDDIMHELMGRGIDRRLSFAIMESVRKGKGLTAEWEQELRRARVPEWYIHSCNRIEYMFPKAHAVAYVMMAFRIAWFKVHRPLEFYAAYFTKRAKYFDIGVAASGIKNVTKRIKALEALPMPSGTEEDELVSLEVVYEFYLRGFSFAPPHVNISAAEDFTVEPGGKLRPPLTSIPGLGEVAASSIAARRGNAGFTAVDELSRTTANSANIESLRAAGALEGLYESLQVSFI